jgi:hypothetical protein
MSIYVPQNAETVNYCTGFFQDFPVPGRYLLKNAKGAKGAKGAKIYIKGIT